MTAAGYFRFPTIHADTVVFVCEDDLWTVSASGGVARRLTSNLGEVSTPALSPDGEWLAFIGREEGHPEVYLMPAVGGQARRLTFLGATTRVIGWSPDGQDVLFASDAAQAFDRHYYLYAVAREGGEPRLLPSGPAVSISYGPEDGRVIGRRNALDLSLWKRYRGGTAGDIWIDEDGSGQWRRLCGTAAGECDAGNVLQANVALPLWLGQRIYFLSDHEGIANIYSCLPDAADLRRHTRQTEYYARNIASDGQRIVYHAGADLYVYDLAGDTDTRIEVELYSPRVQRNRRFVEPAHYLQSYDINPHGHAVALASRGKVFTMANWEGAVFQHGEELVPNGEDAGEPEIAVRRHLATWLHDGQRLVAVSDAEGEEALEIHTADLSAEPKRLSGLDIGRPIDLVASPYSEHVALSNHRHELILVDLAAETAQALDRSLYSRLRGIAWSPDGNWLAYGFPNTAQTSLIKLCKIETGETWEVTKPVLRDEEPAWDPEGRFLYFLSAREFDPVYDSLHFDLNFPGGMRPYLITLQADLLSPFIPVPHAPGDKPDREDDEDGDEAEGQDGDDSGQEQEDSAERNQGGQEPAEAKKEDKESRIEIDLEGITERIIAFPVDDGLYDQIRGLKGKVLFSSWPIEGSSNTRRRFGTPPSEGVLEAYDFAEQKLETLVDGVTSFEVSMDSKTLIYQAGNRLRVIKAGEKPDNKAGSGPSRQSGWLDLGRLKIAVLPGAEWAQMYRHAWRLQRDQFWTEDMAGVDWQAVYRRYWPVLTRVATRSEFSDLMWEMQGELGTSHAYELGGDYKPEPDYYQGFLGADLNYDEATDSYHVERIVRGDPWEEGITSPLGGPGINVKPGDRLLAINGRRLGRTLSPQQLLVNRAGEEVALKVAGQNGTEARIVTIKTLRSERAARYRDWVEDNRRRIHEATGGRVGYVHIPDMGPGGYAEFHRGYLAEVVREGLIVDVRFNRGGHVSQLLLEKLARRRVGYDVQRWGQPDPYPRESVMGPMVALTNEYAGSDGDIFSHAFKMLRLGPLIGKRTWGGVIGIWPREALIDGGYTTQPEFSFWFEDVGWGVENYGTDSDIEVEIMPQDYVAGRDPQMERGIQEILRMLEENPPKLPDFGNRPRRDLPQLPA